MSRLAAWAAALSMGAAIASDLPAKQAPLLAATLAAGALHEECVRLEAGDKRRYEWKSSEPVDFNIHFHRGNDVLFPVKKDAAVAGSGTFTAQTAEDYCWMWTALAKPSRIEGSIKVE